MKMFVSKKNIISRLILMLSRQRVSKASIILNSLKIEPFFENLYEAKAPHTPSCIISQKCCARHVNL